MFRVEEWTSFLSPPSSACHMSGWPTASKWCTMPGAAGNIGGIWPWLLALYRTHGSNRRHNPCKPMTMDSVSYAVRTPTKMDGNSYNLARLIHSTTMVSSLLEPRVCGHPSTQPTTSGISKPNSQRNAVSTWGTWMMNQLMLSDGNLWLVHMLFLLVYNAW